jgi:hypothetical protein
MITLRCKNRKNQYRTLRLNVTVCIAVETRDKENIVTVSDRRISFGDTSLIPAADSAALKNRSIHGQWALLFAANDIAPVTPIIDLACTCLDGTQTFTEAKDAVSKAYREIARSSLVDRILAKYGFERIEEFWKVGLSQFGEKIFSDIKIEIDKFDLGVTLLIYGFDEIKQARIFQVEYPGIVSDQEMMGIGVIGSGAYLALASLTSRSRPASLAPTIYRALEAKFCAETVTAVGRSTSAIVVKNNGHVAFISQKLIESIRDDWERSLEAPLDADLIKKIEEGTKFNLRKALLEKKIEKMKDQSSA